VLSILVLMLSPMTPHASEEMWEILGNSGTISAQKWPAYREDLTREEQVEVVIQINGRMRGKILVEAGLSEGDLRERVLNDARIAPLLAGKQVVKVIVVPGKLVNIVLK
jgi:leucyl-tRNA synthetase